MTDVRWCFGHWIETNYCIKRYLVRGADHLELFAEPGLRAARSSRTGMIPEVAHSNSAHRSGGLLCGYLTLPGLL